MCSAPMPCMLPRIVALGDIDEDELEFAQAAGTDLASLDTPPALDGVRRRLLLAQLIDAWAKQLKPGDPAQAPLVIGGPASTLALADDLARLMDDMATRGVDWNALDGLVPDALDQYWQLTLRFLNIAREVWPDILEAHGRIEPAARRDQLIEAEAARLTQHHDGPVIAAGSTGSMPATARFLKVIAGLPQGAVVLPGLDTDLDDEAWQLIGGTTDAQGKTSAPASNHPQFAMHALLDKFGLKRSDVESLGTPAPHGRELLMSEAMRPSNATAQWHRRLAEPEVAEKISAGMQNLAVIEAANPEMEALAIAVAMREARELGKSAALVTPDRALARRVEAALGRWNLAFDDSGGDALMDTPAGNFRAAGGGGGVEAAGAANAAGAAEASAAAAGRRAGRVQRARSRRWNWRCCAARVRRREAADWRRNSFDFARSLPNSERGETSTLHASNREPDSRTRTSIKPRR